MLSGHGSTNCSKISSARSRFDFKFELAPVSILADRSRINTSISGELEEREKNECPPIIGRAIAKHRQAKAIIRISKVNHRLIFDIRDELFLACSKKRVAAHGFDRWRSKLSRCMINGVRASKSPHSAIGWRNDIMR